MRALTADTYTALTSSELSIHQGVTVTAVLHVLYVLLVHVVSISISIQGSYRTTDYRIRYK